MAQGGRATDRRRGCTVRRALLLLLLAGPALAAEPAAAPPAASADAPVEVQMKEVEIRGEVERPEVFYIIPRREARLELAPLSKDYRDEIAEPLLPGPFEEWARKAATKP